MKKRTVIIGAGPSGISCAYELSRNGEKPLILEKSSQVGGLAKTLVFHDGDLVFRSDIGPHRFHSNNGQLLSIFKDLLKEDWITIPRRTRQLIDGKFYDYPINAMQALRNIGLAEAFRMMFSYVFAFIQYRVFRKKINNIEDYIVANFGRRLGEFNMLNYTEKIWGISCDKLHADWAKQRIRGLSLIGILKGIFSLGQKKDTPKTLIESFYYSRNGAGMIYEKMAEKAISAGSELKFRSYPAKIRHSNGLITEVVVAGGMNDNVAVEDLASSIPVTELLKLFDPPPPALVLEAMNGLKWRSQVYLFVTLNRQRVTNDNWIYFPQMAIPFSRIAEMRNFVESMAPPGKTIVVFEFCVNEGDNLWNKSKEELTLLVGRYAEQLGLFSAKEIRNSFLLKEKYVYPIYDLFYKDRIAIVGEYIDNFKNLFCIGRQGSFFYANQDQSMEMGLDAAQEILKHHRAPFREHGKKKAHLASF